MSERSFIDTNVLVYTDDNDEPSKQEIALTLIEEIRRERRGLVSTQVLQEYFVTSTRKLGVAPDLARRKVDLFARLGLVEIQLSTILAAIDLHQQESFSFWDALIIRTALQAGCQQVLTEDMQPGRVIDGLEIVNPFS